MALNLVQWGRGLFHITHEENVAAILTRGLYSKTESRRLKIRYRSIADEGIQARRSTTSVPLGLGGTIHDYVPLFFGARPPMLCAVKFRIPQDQIVYVVVSWEALYHPTTVFTDGNAATAGSSFFQGVGDLGKVDQEAVAALWWNKPPELRRKKAAEVLVWRHVLPDLVTHLVTMDENARQRVSKVLGARATDRPILVAPEFYYT